MLKEAFEFSAIGTAVMSLGLGAALPVLANNIRHTGSATLYSQVGPTLLSQANNCRRVTPAISGLNIRQGPSLSADVVGVLSGGQNITIDSRGQGGWVPLEAPVEGFVAANYLILCEGATETSTDVSVATAPTELCREVIVRSGLNVRAEPTVYSTRLGALPTGTQVQTSGEAVNNWVPITEPIDGFVASRFLGSCY